MENLADTKGSTKPRRIHRAVGVAVKIEETPLLNPNIYETIQPSMTDIQDPTEELNIESRALMCSDTLRIGLINQMKNVGRIRLLEDIEQGQIKADNIPHFFETSSKLEKNISFLWSAFLKRSDLLKGLLSIGAELNFCDQNGFSALHLAAFSGCLRSTSFLISKQMEVNMQPKCYTPLHCATFGNSVETAKILLNNGAFISIDTKTPSYEQSLLHCAVRANSLDCVKLFINEGADVNSLKPSGANAIHLAAYLGKAHCLEALLNAPGADPNRKISNPGKKSTALHLAAYKDHVECVKLLLAKGADSNLKNDWGLTALHVAARNSYLECVKLLLKKGNANVNHQDMYGFTALHLAAYHGRAQCVEMLISFGADVTIKSEKGISALNFIIRQTPDFIAMIRHKFDRAITLNHSQHIKNIDVELKLNFRELLQHSHPHEISYLHTFVDEGRKEILEHPLCSAFLHIKWKKIQIYYLYSLMYYWLFVLLLELYTLYFFRPYCYIGSTHGNITIQAQELCQKQSILGDLFQINSFVMQIQNCYNGSKDDNTTIQAQEQCQKQSILGDLLQINSFVMKIQNCYNGSKDDNTTIQAQEQCQKQSIHGDLLQIKSFVMKIKNCYNGSKDDNITIQAQELCQKQSILEDLFQINSFVMKIQNCYNGSKDVNTTFQAQEQCQKQSILGDLYQINSFVKKIQNCYNSSKNDNTTIQAQEQCQKQSIHGDLLQINSFVMKIQNCYNGSKDVNTTIQAQEQCQKQSILGDLYQINSFVRKIQNCYNSSKNDNTTIQAQELCQKQSILGDLFQINSFVMQIQNCYNSSKDDNTTIQAQEQCQKQSILGDLYQINSFVRKIQNCYNSSKDDNITIQAQELCQKQSILGDLFQINSFVMKIQNCYNSSKDDNTTIQAQEQCQKQSILGDLYQINSFVRKIQNCYNSSKDDNTTIQAQELCQKQSILGDLFQINSFIMKMQNCYNGSKGDNTTFQSQLCQEDLNAPLWLLVILTFPEIFRKLCGMTGYSSYRHYLTQKENYLEWFVIFLIYDIPMKQTYTYHYPIGVIGVILACTNVMLKISQLPVFIVYVAMYTKVLKEVAKLFIVYSCMLFLFTISFCIIFPSSSSFADPIMGFISVLLMMIGELDISLLLNDPDGKDSSVLLKIIGIITFVLFLFFVPITLMNLLVGIAVHDIQGLKKTAEQSKLVQQTKLIYYMESILFVDNQPTWLNKIIKFCLNLNLEPFQEELCVKPFNLGEKKLPRDILMASYEVAKKHEHSGHTISPRCSEAINFSDNDKNNNNNGQESVRLSRAGICTVTPKNDDIAKRVGALSIEMQELKQLQQVLVQQQQQASKDINKILLVISNQQRKNFEK